MNNVTSEVIIAAIYKLFHTLACAAVPKTPSSATTKWIRKKTWAFHSHRTIFRVQVSRFTVDGALAYGHLQTTKKCDWKTFEGTYGPSGVLLTMLRILSK